MQDGELPTVALTWTRCACCCKQPSCWKEPTILVHVPQYRMSVFGTWEILELCSRTRVPQEEEGPIKVVKNYQRPAAARTHAGRTYDPSKFVVSPITGTCTWAHAHGHGLEARQDGVAAATAERTGNRLSTVPRLALSTLLPNATSPCGCWTEPCLALVLPRAEAPRMSLHNAEPPSLLATRRAHPHRGNGGAHAHQPHRPALEGAARRHAVAHQGDHQGGFLLGQASIGVLERRAIA